MPEGDTVFRAARTLHRALAGKRITNFASVLPKLERVEVDAGVTGRIVERVEANGKWTLMYFSGDLVLLTHMLMSGSWHIYRPGERWKRPRQDMRIVLHTNDIVSVGFKIPVAEFHTTSSLRRRNGFKGLGPSVLAEQFNEAEVLRRLRARPDLEIGQALLRQSNLAGLGNVFKSEICFACRIHPFRRVESLSISELTALVKESRRLLLANVSDHSTDQVVTYTGLRRTTGRIDLTASLWVYQRTGKPCRSCGSAIVSYQQGASAGLTFWCPVCQPLAPSTPRNAL